MRDTQPFEDLPPGHLEPRIEAGHHRRTRCVGLPRCVEDEERLHERLPSGRAGHPTLPTLLPFGFTGPPPSPSPPSERKLPSRSESRMPESVSNSAGTCAVIFARSPVIRLIPVPSSAPPVDTMVILSTLASGLAKARAISGRLPINRSTTAA